MDSSEHMVIYISGVVFHILLYIIPFIKYIFHISLYIIPFHLIQIRIKHLPLAAFLIYFYTKNPPDMFPSGGFLHTM